MMRSRALLWLLVILAVVLQAAWAEEEERPEDPASAKADLGCAVMLMASVTFMMACFYLVNNPDEDIKKASWNVLSTTISIFAAVLLFQGIDGMVKEYILGENGEGKITNERLKLFINFLHAFFWFGFLQCVLAGISGAVTMEELSGEEDPADAGGTEGEDDDMEGEDPAGEESEGEEEEDDEFLEKQRNMKCWAVLSGHITGFACINAFANLQIYIMTTVGGEEEIRFKWDTVVAAWVGVPITFLVLTLIFKVTDKIRDNIAMSDDGKLDKNEKLWMDETEETEDDVMGLATSWVVVQAIQFCILRKMPNEEGEIEGLPSSAKTYMNSGQLVGMGFLVFVTHATSTVLSKRHLISERMTEQSKIICGMIFAWCFFFGMGLMLEVAMMDIQKWKLDESTQTIWAAARASAISAVCFAAIFGLDALADASWTPARLDASLRELMAACGILIGFSWEKGFDAAVETVTDQLEEESGIPGVVTKLVMSIALCALVIPAWKNFFLKELQKMGEFEEEKEEEEEAEADYEEKSALLTLCPCLEWCYRNSAVDDERDRLSDEDKEEREKESLSKPLLKEEMVEGQSYSEEQLKRINAGHQRRSNMVDALKRTARDHVQQMGQTQSRIDQLLQQVRYTRSQIEGQASSRP